ncbi:NDP-sugar dehydratase or epimerase [Chitinivibrio alkaliphilus]|uniref:NDP-sugar dehydratase or epimerase n=1 Tax=Chitinivibrio alkaliphilus ACht1 TaxID=1313304 RepID=U7D8Q2_9BACT|nr:NDP-sugar dehydratase or epimerase [Chitinivibrio alkaliphilus]ERP30810.1 NDP-sugar dehydratase or epimerase [Chitinivibrio alkaliphilus ACht1]
MKKVLIFGATGHTGAYLTDYCLKNLDLTEYQIVAIGRKETDYFENKGIEYFSVDITKSECFDKLPTEYSIPKL